jgi:N-acyl homoserine lactone hydrolase
MRVDQVARLDLGTFVRPSEETGTDRPRVEAVLGYVARTSDGVLLLDTGLGDADAETEARYRPRRVRIEDALGRVGLTTRDIDLVVNCHLHFDHIGGNPSFAGRPIYCQRRELETARTTEYTVPELVDFTGVRYELLDGEAEIAAGVHVIPTPGHVDGHQSVVLECDDGSIVHAGRAPDTASQSSTDALARRPRSGTSHPASPNPAGGTPARVPSAAHGLRSRRRGAVESSHLEQFPLGEVHTIAPRGDTSMHATPRA